MAMENKGRQRSTISVRLMPKIFRRNKSRTAQHICDITSGSESHLPRLPPNARFSARFKRRLQKILIVSSNHPSTLLYLRSKAAIAFEKRRHGVSNNWWIIHPCSNFRFFWDCVMTITYIYLFVAIPHMISFHRMPQAGTKIIEEVLTPGYILCLIDICFNFITGYISPDGHEILIDPMLIFKYYSKKLFIIDILSSVPYTWFYNVRIEVPHENLKKRYLLFFELLPLIKMGRIYTLRNYIKEIAQALDISRVNEHGLWIILFSGLLFHWAACFTYVMPFFYAYFRKYNVQRAEGYLFDHRVQLYNQPNWYIYLTSLHMGAGNLCSYSFTEFRFTDLPDKLSRCLLLLCGMAYYLYVIVIVLQLVGSSAEPELKYQSIMQGVKDYINHKKLPKELKERLLHFYDHRFQGSLFKERAITSTLSHHLKHEITQHSSRILLETTPLFNNIPRSLLNSIIGVLKQEIFLEGDVIFKCNTEGKCMYFIVTGTVTIISFSGNEIWHVNDGDYFGEVALIQHDHKRLTSAIALEVCEVLRLDRRDFTRLVPTKSEFFKRLENDAHRKINEIEAKEYDKSMQELQRTSGLAANMNTMPPPTIEYVTPLQQEEEEPESDYEVDDDKYGESEYEDEDED